jgi:hypothetical protein
MKWDSSLSYEQDYVPPDMASLWSSAVCYFVSPNGVIGTEVVNFDIQVGADSFNPILGLGGLSGERPVKNFRSFPGDR